MLADIESAIIDRLKQGGMADLSDLTDALIDPESPAPPTRTPAVDVVVNAAEAETDNAETTLTVTASVYLVVKRLRDAKDRRTALYPLIEAVMASLSGFVPVPGCSMLLPVAWDNVTTEAFSRGGYLVFQLDFAVSFPVVPPDESVDEYLTAILGLYLHTAEAADVESEITFDTEASS